jgi:hypothetical protein
MPKEHNFAKGCWVREKRFDNGNTILCVSCTGKEFTDWLREISDGKGQCRFIIAERKQVSESGVSHNVYQDTYEPKARTQDDYDQRPQEERQQAARTATGTGPAVEDDQDNLPF